MEISLSDLNKLLAYAQLNINRDKRYLEQNNFTENNNKDGRKSYKDYLNDNINNVEPIIERLNSEIKRIKVNVVK